MKHRLLRIYWTLFGWPDLPPKNWSVVVRGGFRGPHKYCQIAALWLAGFTVEALADKHNCTRERVKQCIWKAYRESVRN